MITDLIVTWPRNCDYPKWRQFVHDNRDKFNEVIIAFTETNQGDDYRDFVKKAMFRDYVHLGETPTVKPGDDWRNVAVNAMLIHSYNASWIWFTEQDFYPLDGFWENVRDLENKGCEVIAAYQGDRMHPCCIFITRNALNRTRKNFGIVPDKSDHFSMLQYDIEKAGFKIGVINPNTYQHLNGLSHNMMLLARGDKPNYDIKSFTKWVNDSLKVTVPIDKRFVELAVKMR